MAILLLLISVYYDLGVGVKNVIWDVSSLIILVIVHFTNEKYIAIKQGFLFFYGCFFNTYVIKLHILYIV